MYSEKEKQLIWFTTFDFFKLSKQNSVLKIINVNNNLFEEFKIFKKDITKVITNDEYAEMLEKANYNYVDKLIENYNKVNICFVTTASKFYPKLLKETPQYPNLLYAKGNLDLLNSNCLACVGSRRITNYGAEVTETFCKVLCKHFTLVSGLADGVDTVVAKTAVKQKCKTIAVLGGGINEIYPQTNTNLANDILKNNGLIISEYKPNEKPQTYYFPIRNRIIAGISLGTLITEATLKSGSMHTKNYTLDYNRDLFVVPGRINDKSYEGCNRIIKSMQGAIVLEPNDILSAYSKELETENKKQLQLSIFEAKIVDVLNFGEASFDELLEKTELDYKTLATNLVKLEIKKIIKKLPNNYYEL